MTRKVARPVLIETDIEFMEGMASIPKVYKPEHTVAQIRRWEGMKEMLNIVKENFLCPT